MTSSTPRPDSAPRARIASGALILLVFTISGCSQSRPVVEGTPACTTWEQDLAPALATECAACHTGDAPKGGWLSSGYLGAVGIRGSKLFATAGDAASPLVSVLSADAAEPGHRASEALRADLKRWVVDCRLAFSRGNVHAPGILNPADAEFHGKLLRSLSYDFALCARCHGEDFKGGGAKVACTDCHAKGPTDCTTCHGAIATKGAHGPHLAATAPAILSKGCDSCHAAPHKWDDVGHILNADKTLDPLPPEVKLGESAAITPEGATRAGPPAFDATSQQCSNVYCHGSTIGDPKAKNPNPKWSDPVSTDACGMCHGVPPQNHGAIPLVRCPLCHEAILDTAGHHLQPAKHLDGHIDVRTDLGSCTACHGTGTDPAPPRDLEGNTAISFVTVGAHQAHLNPRLPLSGRVACGDCHHVPASVLAEGHVDSAGPAEVFPSTIAATSKAFAGGAVPVWDRESGTCSNVACHGGGTVMGRDQTPGLKRSPSWTNFEGIAVCGSCHGLPPADDKHNATMKVQQCFTCHPSIDQYGNPIITGAPGSETSAHINGVVDVLP